MGKILLGNFPYPINGFSATGTSQDLKEFKLNFFMGFDHSSHEQMLRDNTLSKLFESFIIHDVIYLNYAEVVDIIEVLGVSDTVSLLRANAIKIIEVGHFPCIAKRKGDPSWSLRFLSPTDQSAIDFIVQSARHKDSLASQRILAQLELLVGDNVVAVDSSTWEDKIRAELDFDLSNGVFKSYLGILGENTKDLDYLDIPRVMRLAFILSSLTLQDSLKINDVALDGFAEKYLNKKFSVFTPAINKSTSAFESIVQAKGIPNLYELYRDKVLSIDDIISIRDSAGGRVFRHWYESTDYNHEEALRVILNRKSESLKSRVVRFVYPVVSGLISPVAGIAASTVDSFLISRFVEGWKPSLFLDDVLMKKIDDRVEKSNQDSKREQLRQKFGNVGRNSECPCGSGKKFKKCHGADL